MLDSNDIHKLVKDTIESINIGADPSELYDPIKYIMSLGGKRIRPQLCLITYNLFKEKFDNSITYPAVALEIFHAFTLVHDDIMDKSDMRRGKLTIHKKWCDNIAILSGDVMSIKSYEFLSHAPAAEIHKALKLFSLTASQVCEGQQYDMNFEKRDSVSIDEYLMMIGLKTAVLIACSAKLGAIIAGAKEDTTQALYDFGYQLGIAFQIADDYLDVYGDSSVFGKNIGGDIVNNKKSWLLVKAQEIANEQQKQSIVSILEMKEEQATDKIKLMTELYSELNIPELAEREIEKYHQSALNHLSTIDIPEEKLITIKKFATSLTNRKF